MELHQLRYFRAVARYGSFTRAAEHEHVAQPSLSQQIRKLEDELTARLFNRLSRKVTLTEFGERFLDHAQKVEAELEGARQEIEALRGLRQGSVSLGAIPTVAPYLLPPLLKAFRIACPQIQVRVVENLKGSLLRRLAEGELDLALLSLPVEGREFIPQEIIRDRMLLALPLRHPLCQRDRRRVALRDLSHESFLMLEDGYCFRSDVLNLCKDCRLNPRVVFEGGQFETLIAMVSAGFGITLLPEMGRRRFERAGVVLLKFLSPEPARTIGIVRWSGRYFTPAARSFTEVAQKLFERGRGK